MSSNKETEDDRLSRLEAGLERLASIEAIRDILHRYCRSVDRCDLEGLKSCYWPDGFDDHGFFGGNAHAFADYVIPVLKEIESSVHSITNEIIELDGMTAFSECQFTVFHRLRSGDGFLDYMHQGRYIDTWECREGVWKIHTRILVSDMDRMFRVADMRAIMDQAARQMGLESAFDAHMLGQRAPEDLVFSGKKFTGKVNKARVPTPDLWGGFHSMAPIFQAFQNMD